MRFSWAISFEQVAAHFTIAGITRCGEFFETHAMAKKRRQSLLDAGIHRRCYGSLLNSPDMRIYRAHRIVRRPAARAPVRRGSIAEQPMSSPAVLVQVRRPDARLPA